MTVASKKLRKKSFSRINNKLKEEISEMKVYINTLKEMLLERIK